MSEVPEPLDCPSPGNPPTTAPRPHWFAALTRFDSAILIGLVLSILVIYSPVIHFDFIQYDDDQSVYANPHITTGLTWTNVEWAFTAVVSANWMPVTLLSHMLVVQFFGLQSGVHHLVNVAFHVLSTLLLFIILRRTAGSPVASAFVAFVFALHPLHVESVAWIAERKDVLSTSFWFLATLAYLHYVERPSLRRYLWIVLPFCLGLMSKPMLVTFPFTLLLLDIWPLRRPKSAWPKLVWEKLPLVALSIAACVVTYLVQGSKGAVGGHDIATLIENALVSYVTYLFGTFWPTRLAVFYPYPSSIPVWHAAAALVLLLAVSALALYGSRTRPYLAMGWFWFLGTLVPVIGLVAVGSQSHADRYMYVPMLGLTVILAWGALDLLKMRPRLERPLLAAAILSCAACMGLTWRQLGYWRNSETLFNHAIDVTENNWLMHYNLGTWYMRGQGGGAAAIEQFEATLRLRPGFTEAANNLGACYLRSGLFWDAIPRFEEVLRVKDDFPARYNLAVALSKTPGREREAIDQFEHALRLNPDSVDTHRELATVLENLGRNEEAIKQLESAQRLHPDPATQEHIDRLQHTH